eukprot:TRINITY_DN5093_c0_g1_i1.p1 TRINITY_DN5093_c0_g1~~TRINITY_DN5093_c0_g1_i1.p1  ORF type:complete len:220 (-),score=28.52 TRINITY_DN5093_c0_g1_i1:268-876(-)
MVASITRLVLLSSYALVDAIEVCPGESARYGDHKCNHDQTHRVCATLLDKQGQPLNWGDGDFWEITGQKAFQWDADIRANHGDSWCICMWATARLIESAGCDNVHLNCDATDVAYVEKQYSDGGVDLAPAKKCLEKKCPQLSTHTLYDARQPPLDVSPVAQKRSLFGAPAGICLLIVAGVALAVVARRGQRSSTEDNSIEIE